MECLLETVGEVEEPFPPLLWDSSLAGTLGEAGNVFPTEVGVTGEIPPVPVAQRSRLYPELDDSSRLSILLAFRNDALKKK